MERKYILNDVNKYYSQKIKLYGDSPKGVDWKDANAQLIRFEQLIKIIKDNSSFSINDLGCGYGELFFFLKRNNYCNFHYQGCDISQEMIDHAEKYLASNDDVFLYKIEDICEMKVSDYTIANGIFNVRLFHKETEWEEYVLDSIMEINKKSNLGFAFNVLTSYSDADYKRDDLFYASPEKLMRFCMKNISKNIALFHDYNLYEFTLLIRKK